jgi:hypothetical protein
LIRRAAEWDKELRADPFGAAARLAANLGGLRVSQVPQQQAPPQHDPRLIPARSFEEHVSNIERGIALFIQGEAPDFDQYAHEVASLIRSGAIPAHLDNHTRLRLAYATAKEQAAGKKVRVQKSVSGGGGPSVEHSQGRSTSIRGAIERAMRGV